MDYTISSDKLRVTVTDAGGTMKSIFYLPENEERQWQGEEFWKSQDIVIFPVVGHAGEFNVNGQTYRLHAHGVVRYSVLSLESQTSDSVTLSLRSNEQTKENYPYDFLFKISYKVAGNSVTVTYFVQSLGGNMPFYVGGHPAMKTPCGEAEIEFKNEESPVLYPIDSAKAVKLDRLKRFIVNKPFFKECKTFQLGSLSGGSIYMHTQDGYTYEYKSDCPLFAFWSKEEGGDYVCVEPWWGINNFPEAPMELTLKPFMNVDNGTGKTFSYTLSIKK